jgi:hypothetical protein
VTLAFFGQPRFRREVAAVEEAGALRWVMEDTDDELSEGAIAKSGRLLVALRDGGDEVEGRLREVVQAISAALQEGEQGEGDGQGSDSDDDDSVQVLEGQQRSKRPLEVQQGEGQHKKSKE